MASIAIPVVGWAVSPLIGKLLDGAKQLLEERSNLAKGFRKELEKLISDLRIVKGVLVDAEEKQSDSDAVHAWLGELKKILYEAEDLLDLHAVHIALKNHRKPADKFLSLFKKSERLSTARKVREIAENLDRICRRREGLGLEIRSTPQQAESASELRRTTPRIQPSAVLGREEEKSEIVELLLPGSERERFLVLPIVGMAGVGKTTLAKVVLSDQDVAASFNLRIWVYVGSSIEFRHQQITMEIVSSIDPERHEFRSWDELQRALVKEIRERQPFLLVLDDAWDTDCGRWSDLLQPLKASGCTGRVIVTTRNRDVAKAIPGGLPPVFLKHLEDRHTWTILKGIAFDGGSSDGYPQLEAIGMEIVSRLKGSPLAAKAIGGILNGNNDVKFWRKILMSKQLKVAHEEDNIFSVLMLSYNNLPAILRQCFLYFSLFPKGYQFTDDRGFTRSFVYSYTKYDVVFQLMAQKFFQSEDGIESEDDGSRYIDKLVNKSLLDYSSSNAQFPVVMIHDLFLMLAELISKDEYLRVSDDSIQEFPENLRHVAFFQKNSNSQMLTELKKHTKLRTILFNNVDLVVPNSRELLDSWFRNLRCLRVLSLHNFSISSLPDSVGDLQLLHLLNLFLPKLKELPESISRLHNLQVLKVRNCSLVALPKSIVGLVNLRYLDVDRNLLELIDGIGKLGNLKQLEAFYVDKQKQRRIAELRDLNGLCVLGIINLENIEGREDAQEAELSRKKELEELELVWNDFLDEKAHLDVLEGLCPYKNLRKLSIKGYSGTHLPCWLSTKSLPFLEVMRLEECSRLEKFSPPGNLHELEIARCPNLLDIPTLPSSLRHLKILDVRKTWSTFDDPIPPLFQTNAKYSLHFLEKLEIIDCENIGGLGTLLEASPSLNYFHMFRVSRCNVIVSHLTALSTIILQQCSTSVVLDLTTLTSLKVLRIYSCPRAAQHGLTGRQYLPCNSLCELIVYDSPGFLTILCICNLFLVSLRELHIEKDSVGSLGFSNCLRCATVLRKLVIYDCCEITSIPEDVLRPLESLKHLSVKRCEQLKELGFQVLVSLKELRIGKCPCLVFSQQSNSFHQLLYELVITDLSEMQLKGLFSVLLQTPKMVEMHSCTFSSATATSVFEKMRQATTLERLEISDSKGPDEFQLEFPCFSFLKSLTLDSCSNITSLPVLSSLERLRIDNCHNLVFGNTLDAGFLLPSLEDLYASNFSLQQLTDLFRCVARSHLKCLSLCSCKELKYFEGDLEKHFLLLSSLEELHVGKCENLLKLPTDFRVFRNLRRMEISSCKNMKDLPEEGTLRSLQQLKIQGCHALESRYGGNEGNLYIKSLSLASGVKF